MYKSGRTAKEISEYFGVDKSTVYYFLHRADIDVKVRSKAESKLGVFNPMWVDNPSAGSIHSWIRRNYPKPKLCEECKIKPPLDLANISPSYNKETYTRDIKNWEWLCRRCHMIKDGRMKKFVHFGKNYNLRRKNVNH